jgi:hypothetical protein
LQAARAAARKKSADLSEIGGVLVPICDRRSHWAALSGRFCRGRRSQARKHSGLGYSVFALRAIGKIPYYCGYDTVVSRNSR